MKIDLRPSADCMQVVAPYPPNLLPITINTRHSVSLVAQPLVTPIAATYVGPTSLSQAFSLLPLE